MSRAPVAERLAALLQARGVAFEVIEHAPARTCEESAAARSTPLASGAKSLVCKAGSDFVLCVLPADRRLATRRARRLLGEHEIRFARADELERLTRLPPGAVPPFGSLFGLPTFCDAALGEAARIHFSAGERARSFGLDWEDYLAVERPRLGRIADPRP